MSRSLRVLFLFALVFSCEAVFAQEGSVTLNCEEFCTDVTSFVNEYIGSTLIEGEWYEKNVDFSADTISYVVNIGIDSDTTLSNRLVVSNGRVCELSQKLDGRLMGLTIDNGKMTSLNPQMFESFDAYSRNISIPIRNSRALFWSGIIEGEYLNIRCSQE